MPDNVFSAKVSLPLKNSLAITLVRRLVTGLVCVVGQQQCMAHQILLQLSLEWM